MDGSSESDENRNAVDRGFLVIFAVPEEAAPFLRRTKNMPGIQVLVSGMGRANAERTVRRAVELSRPDLVFTCGFAGGLDPALPFGQVLYSSDPAFPLSGPLARTGAASARFHFSHRIASTAREKNRLRTLTKADAVEMESAAICELCRARQIPCATVRVILDTAGEDLPVDFNACLGADFRIQYGKLMRAVISRPSSIRPLLGLRKRAVIAAIRLADVLIRVIREAAPEQPPAFRGELS